MKPVKFLAVVAAVALSFGLVAFINHSNSTKIKPNNNFKADGFAVLELFTSEGCSSCPAADELLARIQQEAGDKPVYLLSYHVDYWDRLGWRDAFSQAEFSKRQYQYSRHLNAEVYTPQLVVNGKEEFVGSDQSAITSAISQELSGKATASLALKAHQQAGKLDVNYQADGDIAGSELLLALVQKHAVSKVGAGENGGRTLKHAQIVRNLYKFDLPADKKGTMRIALPPSFNTKDWELVGFVQDEGTGVIKSAARAVME